MSIIEVLSNLKHNGDTLVKGTVFEGEESHFASLVQDGVLRVIEGAKTIAEATQILAKEAEAHLDAAEAEIKGAPQDTWAAKPDAERDANTTEEVKPTVPVSTDEQVTATTDQKGAEVVTPATAATEPVAPEKGDAPAPLKDEAVNL